MPSNLDDVFRALADPERRQLLIGLREQNPLPDDAHWNSMNTPFKDPNHEEYHIRMNHVHLPKLEEANLISWDRYEERIWKGPEFDEIRPILKFLEDHPDTLTPYE